MKIVIFLASLLAFAAQAQTNEFRLIHGRSSDVNSAGWISVTIPEGSALLNTQSLHFDGTPRPQTVRFQIPAVYNFTKPAGAEIMNFPYTPSLFRHGRIQTGVRQVVEKDPLINTAYADNKKLVWKPIFTDGLVLNKSLTVRVWQANHPTTNYDAIGNATITPAKPIFDYGLPAADAATEVAARKKK